MKKATMRLLPILLASSILVSNQSNASVINTLNGTTYEWLEFSYSVNMSRNTVESLFTDSSSVFYGYRYATRVETQALLESYMPYVPAELNHWEAYLAPTAQVFLSDFGYTFQDNFGTTLQTTTDDGVLINYNMYLTSYFLHGSSDECGTDLSCKGRFLTAALDGVVQAQLPPARRGYDATYPAPDVLSDSYSDRITASLLVREIVAVPVPGAIWLFATGIISLIRIARVKRV